MTSLNSYLMTKYRDPELRKVVKYGMVSGVSVVVTLGVQYFCLDALGMRVRWATLTASIAGAVPSYYLNRMWVWGKTGKSHMKREVIPFWFMFFIGLFFSLGAAALAERITRGASEATQHFMVPAFTFLAYGILWVLKYILFNKLLFASHPEDLDPVLDGRSGIPT